MTISKLATKMKSSKIIYFFAFHVVLFSFSSTYVLFLSKCFPLLGRLIIFLGNLSEVIRKSSFKCAGMHFVFFLLAWMDD